MEYLLKHLKTYKLMYPNVVKPLEPQTQSGTTTAHQQHSKRARTSDPASTASPARRQSVTPSPAHRQSVRASPAPGTQAPACRTYSTAVSRFPGFSSSSSDEGSVSPAPKRSRVGIVISADSTESADALYGCSSMTVNHKQAISQSIKQAWKKLNDYYTLLEESPLYAAAVILHPALGWKTLSSNWQSLPDSEAWLAAAKTETKLFFERWYKPVRQSPVSLSRPAATRSSSSRSTATPTYRNWMISKIPMKTSIVDELKAYCQLDPQPADDPIGWWLSHRSAYPTLSQFALDILAIPAMAVDNERCFSKGKLTVSQQHHQLLSSSVEHCQCLKNWFPHYTYNNSPLFPKKKTLQSRNDNINNSNNTPITVD
jgi:hAT family C-terminal dimerisation region